MACVGKLQCIRYNFGFRQRRILSMMIQRFTIALAAALANIALLGCASRSDQQHWTTKNQSMLGVKTDTPSLNVSENSPIAAPATSAAELREPAISVLLQAAESNDPLLRANAIEALQNEPEHREAAIRRGLADENRGVRFVAAMSVGKARVATLAPLVEPLLHDESASVQAAAIFALKRCGQNIDLNPLAAMLRGDDPEVKGNAALVLGELGDQTALPLLQSTAGRGLVRTPLARRKVVDLQMAEAMVKLGLTNELDVIRAALYAPTEEAELAALACQMCGELRDGGAVSDLVNLAMHAGKGERPPEIRMAAALAVAIIQPQRALIEVPSGYTSSPMPEQRAQAAYTLGAMSGVSKAMLVALSHLSRLLNDQSPHVQVAAAGAILRLQRAAPM
jgi:HEAT repeat protein